MKLCVLKLSVISCRGAEWPRGVDSSTSSVIFVAVCGKRVCLSGSLERPKKAVGKGL